jgi:hypothetical protein
MYQLRLANIVGLDTDNAQHSVAIDESLYGVEDQEAFLEYCRDKKDGIQYATKPERLDTLATKYKKLQAQAKLPYDLANSFSSELIKKVETARTYLKNEIEVGNHTPFSRLKVDGEKYFTKKEINALSGLGSARYIIELSEQNTLQEELIRLFMDKFAVKSKYELLSEGQKKVQALIGATA